jgi:uncharacterized protein YqeY
MLAKTAEGATGEVSDQDIVKIIQKLVKQRKESAQQYTDAGRPELAANEAAEMEAMEVYLPKQLSEAEGETELMKIIQKLVKQREESAQQYTEAGRPELAANEVAEMEAMEVYLPKQLTEAEVEAELVKIIAEVGATQPSEMGKVMGVATKRLAGLADGRVISTLVKKLLSQN